MRRFLNWFTSMMSPPRVIKDIDVKAPYLSRWYLFNTPRMPDGSCAWDANGDMKQGHFSRFPFGIYIHKFHQSDTDRELHNHPWAWSVSLILAGGYVEERRVWSGRESSVIQRSVLPGSINFIDHDDFHRVDLIEGDAWSLFIAGPKESTWGFWNRLNGEFTHWREFFARKRNEKPKWS